MGIFSTIHINQRAKIFHCQLIDGHSLTYFLSNEKNMTTNIPKFSLEVNSTQNIICQQNCSIFFMLRQFFNEAIFLIKVNKTMDWKT